MADGNNKRFLENPVNFVQNHQIMINPQTVDQQFPNNDVFNIDLVSSGNEFVRLENYQNRQHGFGSRPIKGLLSTCRTK